MYSSPNIVRVIRSRKIRWTGHVARVWGEERIYRILVGETEGKREFGRPGCRWKDNIKMIFRKWDVGVCTVSIWLRIGTGGGHL
jgi:hypothetical protein